MTPAAFLPLSFNLADRRFIRDARTHTPSDFPVLVITSDKAQIVQWGELNGFINEHSDYSFLIPQDQETRFREQLVKSYRERGIDAYPKFEVRLLSPGRQLMEVGEYGDGAVVGWYEAADREIFPQRFKAYGPGFAFIVLGLVGIFTGLTWGMGFTAFKLYKGMKKYVS